MVAAIIAVVIVVMLGHVPKGATTHAVRFSASSPNILIIVTDDQRGGLSVMPSTRRWFADRGVRFPSAFVTTPLCCPSRASIFTGRYAHNHGVTDNESGTRLQQSSTLQYYLKQAGYYTAMIGKYFNKWPAGRAPPYFDYYAKTHSGAYYHARWDVNGDVRRIAEYSSHYMAERAATLIESHATRHPHQPWFLYLATPAPHIPYTPQKKYARLAVRSWRGNPAVRERNRGDKPQYVRERDKSLAWGDVVRRGQFRTLRSVDDMVGKVFRALRRLGEIRRTLAFFVSDNGSMWGDHGLGGKNDPYTPSIEVPMLMAWKGHVTSGATDPRLVANIDIAPTALAAAGVTASSSLPMDGRSLLDPSWNRRRLLLEGWPAAKNAVPRWASTRTRAYQYIEYYGGAGDAVSFRELYDLRSDPWQLRNLVGDDHHSNDPSRELLVRLHRRLREDRSCVGDACP